MIEPTKTIGVTIAGDHYSVTGSLPGLFLAALGILTGAAYFAAYRSGSPRWVRAASLGLLAAAAYGFLATGQVSSLVGAALLALITWVPRTARATR